MTPFIPFDGNGLRPSLLHDLPKSWKRTILAVCLLCVTLAIGGVIAAALDSPRPAEATEARPAVTGIAVDDSNGFYFSTANGDVYYRSVFDKGAPRRIGNVWDEKRLR